MSSPDSPALFNPRGPEQPAFSLAAAHRGKGKRCVMTDHMNRFFYFAANILGGAVIVLWVIDPTRPVAPILILLGVAVVLAMVPWLLSQRN